MNDYLDEMDKKRLASHNATTGAFGGSIIMRKTCGNCLHYCAFDISWMRQKLRELGADGSLIREYNSVYGADRGRCREDDGLRERHDWCKEWTAIPKSHPYPPRIWPRAGENEIFDSLIRGFQRNIEINRQRAEEKNKNKKPSVTRTGKTPAKSKDEKIRDQYG